MYRILVVDDEPLMGDYVASLLRRYGLRANVVHAAQDALGRLANDGYDAIITDIVMPGMDGIEFVRAVRSLYPDIPVIAVSGSNPDYRQAMMAAMRACGANLAFSRLVEPAQLLRGLLGLCAERKRAMLSGRAAPAEAGAPQ